MDDLRNTHLFIATFEDGQQIFQNADDQSELEPDRNCYFDVLERQKTVPLRCFVLRGPKHAYGVDLWDGHFEIDGIPFFQHRPDLSRPELESGETFRLVYTRTVQHHKHIGSDDGSITSNISGYSLGWECGNVEHVMFILTTEQ